MIDGHLIIGYHGCDVTVRDGLVSGRINPRASSNQYDWLGPGFYLFEGDEDRARSFATTAAQHPQRRLTAQPIATPAVAGCLLSVQRCPDMTTEAGRLEFERAYVLMQGGLLLNEQTPPSNTPASEDGQAHLRGLDRKVFSFIHTRQHSWEEGDSFQAVRGAFQQGVEIAPNSGFHRDSHVQVALRDMTCIKGWFLPPGDHLLSSEQLEAATQRLAQVRAAHPKPRRRSS